MLARYESNAATSLASGAWTVINYEDVVYDGYGLVTTGAAWKFTSIYDGYYYIHATFLTVNTSWASGNTLYLGIFRNGSAEGYVRRHQYQAAVTAYGFVGGGLMVRLAVGDYVDARGNQNTGGAVSTYSSNAYYNQISIFHCGYYV